VDNPPIELQPSNEPEDEFGLTEVKEGQTFRLQVQRIFLTYPACPIKEQPLYELIKPIVERYGIKYFIIAREEHRDGTPHSHIYIQTDKIIDTKQCRFFDIKDGDTTYHPNIRRHKSRPQGTLRLWEYMAKSGKEPKSFASRLPILPTSEQFQRRRRDIECWFDYQQELSITENPWPRLAPFGEEIPFPDDFNRKRHIWISGPSDIGKTRWFTREFGAYRYHEVVDGQQPFDDYQNQRIILYDDVLPSPAHISRLANRRIRKGPCPGQQRFYRRYLQGEFPLLIIVLRNETIEESYPDGMYPGGGVISREVERQMVLTRFREFKVTQPSDLGF